MSEYGLPELSAHLVLSRARDILSAGPLDPEDQCSEGGPWCPWCAIARAKSGLDEELGAQLSFTELAFYWDREHPTDAPLVGARARLKPFMDGFPARDQACGLRILDASMAIGEGDGND